MLILAKNKVEFAQIEKANTPEAVPYETRLVKSDKTKSGWRKNRFGGFTPISHASLVNMTREAIGQAGLEITEEEHALDKGDLRYFGGFALKGEGINGEGRQIVLGLRNTHDKLFPASIAIGNRMMVCSNLCFSSDVKLARRHTGNIVTDLPRVIASAISRVTSHWSDMGNRIEAYKQTDAREKMSTMDISKLLYRAKAIPSGLVTRIEDEFDNPRHEEFKGGSLWTYYNAVTEHMKGSDNLKFADRMMTVQSILDPLANHKSELVLPS